MNWITIGDTHYNLDNVQGFVWSDGNLGICVCGREPDVFDDPDKALYHHLCNRVSLLPVEKEDKPDD